MIILWRLYNDSVQILEVGVSRRDHYGGEEQHDEEYLPVARFPHQQQEGQPKTEQLGVCSQVPGIQVNTQYPHSNHKQLKPQPRSLREAAVLGYSFLLTARVADCG